MGKRRSDGLRGPVQPAAGPFLHGKDEAAAWLGALGLEAANRWHIEIALETAGSSQFHVNVYAEEWGFAFHHSRRSSWIRVTDVAFVHGRDDFGLLRQAPSLASLGVFLSGLEAEHGVRFPRSSATIRSNVTGATAAVRKWLHATRAD